MEEIKFVSLFPELNKNNLNSQKTNLKNYIVKKRMPINLLLLKDEFNSSNKREDTDFLKKRVKFFSPIITPNSKKSINKTDFKFPIIKKKKEIHNKLSKTINTKKIPLYTEPKPAIFKIFDKLDEVNKKYNDQTKYYNHYNKNGDNSRKIHINRNLNNFTKFSLLSKNNVKKHYSYIYKRIKTIEL